MTDAEARKIAALAVAVVDAWDAISAVVAAHQPLTTPRTSEERLAAMQIQERYSYCLTAASCTRTAAVSAEMALLQAVRGVSNDG